MDDLTDRVPTSLASRHASGARLHVDVHRPRSGVTLVVVRGQVDEQTAPDLEHALRVATADAAAPRVVVDLSAVTSLDGMGLDCLLRAQARLEATNGRLDLLDRSSAVVMLLHGALRDTGVR